MSRCLYNSSFEKFINADENSIFGALCDNYHGDALTTTREAWKSEISIMKDILAKYADKNGQVIFEYDIPRLGKRIDVVLLLKGIVFCVEFKVGESKILEADIDQVLDYALDLKNFHKFSQDNLIVPILVATNYRNSSTDIRMSVYDDKKMQSSPHFVLRKAAQPPFIYESKNTREKEENFVRNAGNIQRGIYAV